MRKYNLGNWPLIAILVLAILHYPIFGHLIDWRSRTGHVLTLALFAMVGILLILLTFEVIRSAAFQFWRRESSIKLLFDHIRNVGLCGALFYAADFLMTKGAFPTSVLSLAPFVGIIALNIVGLAALGLQVNYFQNSIIKQGIGKYHSYFVLLLNFVLVTAVLQYLAFSKLSVLFTKT